MKRIVLVMAIAITGCGFAPKAPSVRMSPPSPHTQIVATVGQVKTTTGAVATHIDKAATNIGTALQISSTIPSAKPVVAPLQASNDEILPPNAKFRRCRPKSARSPSNSTLRGRRSPNWSKPGDRRRQHRHPQPAPHHRDGGAQGGGTEVQ